MALTFRRGVQSCQAAATKVGSGDPAPQGTRVDGWRRYIVAFGKIFNGILPRPGGARPKGLKRLHHSQNHDQDHEDGWNLVHDPIEPGRPSIGVGGESAHAAGKVAVQPSKTKD
jgi:hypothetical protein